MDKHTDAQECHLWPFSTNTLAHINRYSRRYFSHQRERERGWGGSGRRTGLSTHFFFLHDFLQHVQLPGQEGECRGHSELESNKACVTLICTFEYTGYSDGLCTGTMISLSMKTWAASLKKRVGGVSEVLFWSELMPVDMMLINTCYNTGHGTFALLRV